MLCIKKHIRTFTKNCRCVGYNLSRLEAEPIHIHGFWFQSCFDSSLGNIPILDLLCEHCSARPIYRCVNSMSHTIRRRTIMKSGLSEPVVDLFLHWLKINSYIFTQLIGMLDLNLDLNFLWVGVSWILQIPDLQILVHLLEVGSTGCSISTTKDITKY